MSLLDSTWPLFRSALFTMDAEVAHERTLHALAATPRIAPRLLRGLSGHSPARPVEIAGLTFRSPVGLAAGLDKNGVAIPVWAALGFGFVEVGTVTAHAQPGNPKPRMFRLQQERALINRLGFNNEGSDALATRLGALRLSGQWPNVPVGVNVGKSKITALEDAPDDYVCSIERLQGLADYFTINISSPNTPGLRKLQGEEHLRALLPKTVTAARGTPVFLKIAPDLTDEAIADVVSLAVGEGLSGLIATNTTIRRDLLTTDPNETGGLSGRPLHTFAADRIERVLACVDGRVPVIGVGGIERAEQVRRLMHLGCAAVQIYTSFIYEGPGLPARLNRQLAE